MKVMIYADFRSPHARGWLEGLRGAGIETVAVSSEVSSVAGVIDPVDAGSKARQHFAGGSIPSGGLRASLRSRLTRFQIVHSAVQLYRGRSRRRFLQEQIRHHNPDLVHALRLPYEGVSALSSIEELPVVVSTWGQDFTSQARHDPLLRFWYRRVIGQSSGFMADEESDVYRARSYGLSESTPTLVAAGNFGVDSSIFFLDEPAKEQLVVYARRATPNNNYKGFLRAAVQVIPRTGAHFVGVGLAGQAAPIGQAQADKLELTNDLDRDAFAALLRRAKVVVSPAYSDGMPNSVLEAISCGARVVAGDLPQLRQLKELGLPIELVDPNDVSAMALAIQNNLLEDELPTATALPEIYSIAHNQIAVPKFYETVAALFQDRARNGGSV